MGVLEIVGISLQLAKELIARTPNYSQSMKKKLYKLEKQYNEEINKTREERDDNAVSQFYLELQHFFKSFFSEISK